MERGSHVSEYLRFFHKGQEVDPPLMKISKGSNQLARPNPDMLYGGHPPPPQQGGGRGALCPPSYSGYLCTLCVYPPRWASSDKQESISTDPILISNMYTFRWTTHTVYCILTTTTFLPRWNMRRTSWNSQIKKDMNCTSTNRTSAHDNAKSTKKKR